MSKKAMIFVNYEDGWENSALRDLPLFSISLPVKKKKVSPTAWEDGEEIDEEEPPALCFVVSDEMPDVKQVKELMGELLIVDI